MPGGAEANGLTYAAAGVDLEAGDKAVALMRAAVEATHGPQVLGGLGGFAGAFALSGDGFERHHDPVLVASADGVGTKVMIASAFGRYDTVGRDLVAMVVDDLVVVGARPLFLLDYLAVGSVVPERIAEIVEGVAEGCHIARCALLGGETAEHPGAMDPDAFDLAGFGVGLAERSRLLGPDRVRAGDALLGVAASGLHANGFSLVRRVLEAASLDLGTSMPELGGRPIGEALLEPTRIYAADLIDLLEAGVGVHALCHVTGGGILGNLPRVLPPDLEGAVDRSAWPLPPLFRVIAQLGGVSEAEMERATNLGIGMIVVLPVSELDRASGFLEARGHSCFRIGEVVPRADRLATTEGTAHTPRP